MSASSSPLSAQKGLKAKKNILPRASLIQVFNELPAPSFNNNNNSLDLTQCHLANTTNNKGNTNINLTTSNQGISFATANKQATIGTNNPKPVQRSVGINDSEVEPRSSPSTKFKRQKFSKESKFKEITRLCLYQTQSSNKLTDLTQAGRTDPDNSSVQPIAPQPRTKQSLIQFIAKDFLTDGRQRLDLDTFTKLLMLLKSNVTDDAEIGFEKNLKVLGDIYRLIENDFNLCNKFSSFLTSETALHFGLFTQYCQYEKCYEFLQKLEIFIPNKCTFKKLIQSILASCNSSYEHETVPDKISEIKSKIKAVTKNNALIDFELEYLFDQRWANLEPTYEKISLLDADPVTNYNASESKTGHPDGKKIEPVVSEAQTFYEEFIDLTNGASSESRKKKVTATTTAKASGKLKKKPIAKSKYENKSLVIALKKHVE